MNVLVVNSGSSSIKYRLFDMASQRELAQGLVERIGEAASRVETVRRYDDGLVKRLSSEEPIPDHNTGLTRILQTLNQSDSADRPLKLDAIGHRVVHGGEKFHAATRIDQRVIEEIEHLSVLAPLHNPPNLLGIRVAVEHCGDVPQVAVFDTAFHQSLPAYAYRYALPQVCYEEHAIRRYGMHGTSHFYVAKQAAAYLQQPLEDCNFIILHLGNGASATAVQGGRSVDTSMGLTPLEGLIMGTRTGDLDPAVVFHWHRVTGIPYEEIEVQLNRKSGLRGICGNNDMRAILSAAEEGDAGATLALEMYAYRIRKYIGAYFVTLGRLDALIFTAGIGENAWQVRERVCQGLEPLGLLLNGEANRGARASEPLALQRAESTAKILAIPTNEELEIAEQTVACLQR